MPRKKKNPPKVLIKDGKWSVRISVDTGDRDDKGRKKYMQVIRRCIPPTTERAAELVVELKQRFKRSAVPSEKEVKVNEFIETFLATKKKGVSVRTYEHYEFLYNQHVKPTALGGRLIGAVTTLDVQKWADTFKRSPDAAHRTFRFLTMVFRYAVLWGKRTKNPCTKDIVLPRLTRNETESMTKAEADRLREYARAHNLLLIETGLETGLRPQELLALRWQDVDLVKGTVRVEQALIEGAKQGLFIGPPKTEKSKRTIRITPYLRDRLKAYKERRLEHVASLEAALKKPILLKHKRAKGVSYQRRKLRQKMIREELKNIAEYDLVFPGKRGGLQSRINYNQRVFHPALKKAGVPRKYSLKHLRHTNATLLAEKLNPKDLQARLGHAQLTTTLKYYVHVNEDADNRMAGKLEEALY